MPSTVIASGAAPRSDIVGSNFQALRSKTPRLAAGIATGLMMGHPAFANRILGSIARLVAGHVSRGHCLIVFRDGHLIGDGRQGDCVLLNVRITDDPNMKTFVVQTLCKVLQDKWRLFARRIYSDGRIRPVTFSNTRLNSSNSG